MLKKDPELWFEDGNIILTAGDTQFCVYKGPLIKHSPVFRDMLSLPQPGANNGTEATTPTIPLSDRPEDIRRLLEGFVFGNTLQCVSPTGVRMGSH